MEGVANHAGKIERALLPLWALLISLVGTFPFTNFIGHSHWEYIQWLPTADNFNSRRFLFMSSQMWASFFHRGIFSTGPALPQRISAYYS